MVRFLLIAGLLVSACSQVEKATYVNVLDTGGSATVELPSRLPEENFKGVLTDPAGNTFDLNFEYFSVPGGACYWSRFIYLCSGDGSPMGGDVETPEGRHVRVEAQGPTYKYYVYDNDRSVADFSILRDGRLVSFGVVDQSTGLIRSNYKLSGE